MLSDILDKCLKEVQAEQLAPAVLPVAPITVNPNAPTFKQVEFFRVLVTGKLLTDEQRAKLLESIAGATKLSMSSAINWLMGLEWTPRPVYVPRPAQTIWGGAIHAPRPNTPKIDQGYYAVVDPADQVLKFYQVRVPKQGRWVGYTFVAQVSGDNHFSIRDKAEREKILGEIAKNPLEALKRFGKEIGQCGHCRKQLTDEVSRQFGIGPVCRKALGV
jgi:hypothetical protein